MALPTCLAFLDVRSQPADGLSLQRRLRESRRARELSVAVVRTHVEAGCRARDRAVASARW